MIPDQIEREIVIAASPEKVWSALTEARHLGTWFGDAGAEIDLRPGGRMAVSWREHGTILCRVEQVDPPHRFAYRWGGPGATEPSGDNSTLVEFSLSPEGAGTRLRVVESGFNRLPVADDIKTAQYKDNTEGWTSETDELAAYVEKLAA
jgi:uncharacterized protein YndB with AHSA1/START domain